MLKITTVNNNVPTATVVSLNASSSTASVPAEQQVPAERVEASAGSAPDDQKEDDKIVEISDEE